jgi:eukaryotic-like serine/threonine-protein kinase
MDSNRWGRLQAALVSVVDCDPADRAALIKRVSAGDDEFRAELESLLSEWMSEPDFLEQGPRVSALGAAYEGEKDSLIGQDAGLWRVVSRIDRGGMGAVYLAQRRNGDFAQHVAIKFIARGMDSDALIARFREERRILAALDHPNIVAIIDGGTTEDGRPWFAMPYLEGAKPIDAYADSQRLTIADRIQIFRRICSAVHFAHQNLIIHRDLKPANILVTPKGVPMLLDFGIAKLLNQVSEGATGVSTRIHTPQYASPEQRRGDAITTASDVYQLGILLYQLLCGANPFPSASEIDDSPKRPSERVAEAAAQLRRESAESLRRRLRGDLDTICLHALDAVPQRRYRSAESLSDDLELHQRGLPVHARPDTLAYRVSKFLRRNRWGTAFAATLFAAAVGVSALAVAAASRISAQAETLRIERDRAQASAFYLARVFELTNPEKERRDITAGEMLEHAVAALADDQELKDYERSGVLTMIGDAYLARGDLEKGHGVLIEAVATGRRSQIGGQPYANSLLILAKAEQALKNYEEAERLAREALLVLDDVRDVKPEYRATALNMASVAASELGRNEEAAELLHTAIALRQSLPGALTDHNLAANLSNLGRLYLDTGKLDAAEVAIADSLAIIERKFGPVHPAGAYVRRNRAELHVRRGDIDLAIIDIRDAIDLAEKTLGDSHPFTIQMRDRLAVVSTGHDPQ